MLYDYTKFHIGVYLTLTAAYVAAATATVGNNQLLPINGFLAVAAILAFLLAGMAGGIIVSSITQFVGGSSRDFLETDIGPLECEWLSGRQWTYVEHLSFWVGLILALLSVAFPAARLRGLIVAFLGWLD